MIKLPKALAAWGTHDFENTLKDELQQIDAEQLPLQEALSQSSYVSETNINAVILNVTETKNSIRVKGGIFYAGVIAGSCCADDPSPVDEQTEYCEMQFNINKKTAETTITILQ